MDGYVDGKPLYGKPAFTYFTGTDKYLQLQKIDLTDAVPPTLEDDSVFLYVKSGTGTMTVNGVIYAIGAGTFCWIQSYHVYSIVPKWGEKLELLACVYDYPLSSYLMYLDSSSITLDVFTLRPPIISCDKELMSRLESIFEEFADECRIEDVGSTLIRVSLLGELAHLFTKESLRLLRRDGAVRGTIGGDVLVYLSMFCSQDLTASEIAEVFGINTKTLNIELRKVCGMGFAKALSRARVNLAASSVLFGELSYSYISVRVGFKADVGFYRAFKEFKGMTPQEYRDMCMLDSRLRKPVDEMALSVLNYIYGNYREQITLESLSKALYLSESTVRKVLKDSFDKSFQELLTDYRLNYARAMLVISDMPIIDISVMVGLNSERTFARLFKAANNMSPSEYRRKYRRDKIK